MLFKLKLGFQMRPAFCMFTTWAQYHHCTGEVVLATAGACLGSMLPREVLSRRDPGRT